MPGVGQIAGGENAGDAGFEVFVGDDPVLHFEPGSLRQRDPRRHPHADDDQIPPHHGVIVKDDRIGPGGPPQLCHPSPEMPLHPVINVDVPVEGPELGPEHALEGHVRHLDQGDVRPQLASRRRDLTPDPAGTDDHDAVGFADGGLQAVRIGHGAEIQHALEI